MFVENDYLETRLPRQMFRMRILATVAGFSSGRWTVGSSPARRNEVVSSSLAHGTYPHPHPRPRMELLFVLEV